MAKSHVERLRDGERNTRFFQISVLMERNSNGILSLNDNVGNRLPGPIDIRNHISDFFFFITYIPLVIILAMPTGQPICVLTNLMCCLQIRRLGQVCSPCTLTKPRGPDGLHPIFFQNMWDVVVEEVCLAIKDWCRQGDVPNTSCEALIFLIPKQ